MPWEILDRIPNRLLLLENKNQLINHVDLYVRDNYVDVVLFVDQNHDEFQDFEIRLRNKKDILRGIEYDKETNQCRYKFKLNDYLQALEFSFGVLPWANLSEKRLDLDEFMQNSFKMLYENKPNISVVAISGTSLAISKNFVSSTTASLIFVLKTSQPHQERPSVNSHLPLIDQATLSVCGHIPEKKKSTYEDSKEFKMKLREELTQELSFTSDSDDENEEEKIPERSPSPR